MCRILDKIRILKLLKIVRNNFNKIKNSNLFTKYKINHFKFNEVLGNTFKILNFENKFQNICKIIKLFKIMKMILLKYIIKHAKVIHNKYLNKIIKIQSYFRMFVKKNNNKKMRKNKNTIVKFFMRYILTKKAKYAIIIQSNYKK